MLKGYAMEDLRDNGICRVVCFKGAGIFNLILQNFNKTATHQRLAWTNTRLDSSIGSASAWYSNLILAIEGGQKDVIH